MAAVAPKLSVGKWLLARATAPAAVTREGDVKEAAARQSCRLSDRHYRRSRPGDRTQLSR